MLTEEIETEIPEHLKDLNDKERVFVAEFVRHLNRAKAARNAGYDDDNAYKTGNRLLRLAKISRAVKKEFDLRAKRLRLDADLLVMHCFDSFMRCIEKGADTAAAKFLDMLFKYLGMYEKDNRQKAGTESADAIRQRFKERGIDLDHLKPPPLTPSTN